jgi:AcrR family transcriptional regulator
VEIKNTMKKSEITRQRVLAVSSALFQKKGYQETSMRDIAAAVGMKSGSLYYYYESKEALLAANLNNNIDATLATLRDSVAALPSGTSVRDKFDVAVNASIQIVLEAGDMSLASARTLSLLQEPEYSEQVRHRQAYNQFWRDLISEGKKSGEIRARVPEAMASMLIVGALAFVPEWYEVGRSPIDKITSIFTDLLFKGLGS